MVILLPFGMELAKNQQIFRSRATEEAISIGEGNCIEVRNGKKVLICNDVPLKLISPLAPPYGFGVRRSPSPTSRVTPKPSPSSSTLPTACNSSVKTSDGKSIVNVKSFNNDIQLAIDCFKDLSGGAVYIPAGTYTITKKVSVYSNMTVFGDGIDRTIITTSSTTEGGMSNDSSKGQANIVIRDMTLKGPGNKGGNCCYGLKLENLSNGYVVSVAADNWGMDGIYLGYKLKDGTLKGANGIRISSCRTSYNDRNGISLTHGNNNVIDNCRVEFNSADPVKRASAIDLEPDSGAETSNNFIYENIVNGNKGNGIGLGPNPNEPPPLGKLSNNVVCFNTTSDNDFAGIANYQGTIYFNNKGNDPQPKNNGNESNCQYPTNLKDLPVVPSKPVVYSKPVFNNLLLSAINFLNSLVKEALAGCSQDEDCGSGMYCDKHNSTDGSGSCKPDGKIAGSDKKKDSGSKSGGGNKNKATSTPTSQPTAIPTASASATPTRSPSPSPIPIPLYTDIFKVSELESTLRDGEENDYDDEPMLFNYDLQNTNPGFKTIWVEFVDSENRRVRRSITIELVAPDPEVDEVSCKLDIAGNNVVFDASGENFGTIENAQALVGSDDLQILEWTDTQISAILGNPTISGANTQQYNLKLIRGDGQESANIPCKIGLSQVSLGTEIFCREKGNKEEGNISVIFVSDTGEKAQEVVTIDKEGTIKDPKTKLETGKNYLMSIKPSNGLRRNANFTASSGTSVVKANEEDKLILPIGDIFPQNGGDGAINSADKIELGRQWIFKGENLSGDFNRDGVVNSIDWACMRRDFGKTDDPLPDKAPVTEE